MFKQRKNNVINRGDETSNTVMKEFFSWHSTLKPEDAFLARTQNDNARQDILDAHLATVCFPPKDINIYVRILKVHRQCVLLLHKKTLFKQNECATGAWMGKCFNGVLLVSRSDRRNLLFYVTLHWMLVCCGFENLKYFKWQKLVTLTSGAAEAELASEPRQKRIRGEGGGMRRWRWRNICCTWTEWHVQERLPSVTWCEVLRHHGVRIHLKRLSEFPEVTVDAGYVPWWWIMWRWPSFLTEGLCDDGKN